MITILATFAVKPECAASFKELAAVCIAASREEDGNVDYHFYGSMNDSSKFFFVEVWRDKAAIEAHNDSAHFKAFVQAFTSLLAKDPIIEQAQTI